MSKMACGITFRGRIETNRQTKAARPIQAASDAPKTNNAPRVCRFAAHRENLVLGVSWPNHVCGINAHQFVGNRLLILVARRWRCVSTRDPVGQRESDIEIFRRDDVFQIFNRTVKVRITRVPAARRRGAPSFEADGNHEPVFVDANGTRVWKVRFAAFDLQRVLAGGNLRDTVMGRNGRVVLDRVFVDPVLLLVAYRRAVCVSRLKVEPVTGIGLQIQPRREWLSRIQVGHAHADVGAVAKGTNEQTKNDKPSTHHHTAS